MPRRPGQGGVRTQRTCSRHLRAHSGPRSPVARLLCEAVPLGGLIGLDSRGLELKQGSALLLLLLLLLTSLPLPDHGTQSNARNTRHMQTMGFFSSCWEFVFSSVTSPSARFTVQDLFHVKKIKMSEKQYNLKFN